MNNKINLYELSIKSAYRQFQFEKLLFVEYNCLPGNQRTALMSEYNYFVYVVKGKKTWITPNSTYIVDKGEAVFLKKGVSFVIEADQENACVLLFFLPDKFIHEIVMEFRNLNHTITSSNATGQLLLPIHVDIVLNTYFESVLSYFHVQNIPPPNLVKLKFKELIFHILAGDQNRLLKDYFLSLGFLNRVNIQQVMQENYQYNLSIEDFAKICNRSLTSFKRDFHNIYNISPGKWLNRERLQHARMLLLSTNDSISDIAFHSGFETTSHFIRCFKKEFGLPPLHFRLKSSIESNIPA
jgi:AraC-like DNA-binding protein